MNTIHNEQAEDEADPRTEGPPARPSRHRAQAIALPADPAQAAALVLRYVQVGDSAFDRSAAVEGMASRVEKLRGSDGAQVERELLAHAAVLDALFLRYSAEAVANKVPDHKSKLMKLALSAQAAYVRCMVAVEGLRLQRSAAARVVAEVEGNES